ncbi:MAG TPA: hypothetical protein VEA38_18085 [Terriglobales bacterium]|nr:hypothetical protein [Terriglobales bacterium]
MAHALVSLVILLVFVAVPALAQAPGVAGSPVAAQPKSTPADWPALRMQRENLLKTIGEAERRLGTLRPAVSVSVAESNLRRVDADIKKAQDSKRSEEVQRLQDLKVQFLEELKQAQLNVAERKRLEDELGASREQLAKLDSTIGALLTPEILNQNFKFWMSGIFAGLVFVVIVGFFVMAWRDEEVLRAIFAGAAGIQFVTLFSLVIAIILFGITGILEGKELAALLGGLSGYILGRSSDRGGMPAGQASRAPAGGAATPSPQPAPGAAG